MAATRDASEAGVRLFVAGEPVSNESFEPVLDRSVGRDPVHRLSCDVVSLSWSTAVASNSAIAWPLPNLVPRHRALAVDFGRNREVPDDVVFAIKCIDLISCPHQNGLFLHRMIAADQDESVGIPGDSIGSGASKTVVTSARRGRPCADGFRTAHRPVAAADPSDRLGATDTRPE